MIYSAEINWLLAVVSHISDSYLSDYGLKSFQFMVCLLMFKSSSIYNPFLSFK